MDHVYNNINASQKNVIQILHKYENNEQLQNIKTKTLTNNFHRSLMC